MCVCFFSKCRRMYTRATHIAFDTKGERWFCNWVHIYIRFTNILTDFHFSLLLISFIFALLTAFHAMVTISFHFFQFVIHLYCCCFVEYSYISAVLCACAYVFLCLARCIWNLNIHKRLQFFATYSVDFKRFRFFFYSLSPYMCCCWCTYALLVNIYVAHSGVVPIYYILIYIFFMNRAF